MRLGLSGPRLLAGAFGVALIGIGVATPLRGSAFGEPTVLRPQRFARISSERRVKPSSEP